MEWISEEPRQGYTVYTNAQGEEYLVLNGLDPNQIHTPGLIESFLIQHYELLAIAYWILLAVTFTYLLVTYIYHPLRARRAAGLPLFADD